MATDKWSKEEAGLMLAAIGFFGILYSAGEQKIPLWVLGAYWIAVMVWFLSWGIREGNARHRAYKAWVATLDEKERDVLRKVGKL